MITNFNEQLWIDFDLEIAVFLENLVKWLRINAAKPNPDHRNFHEDKYWSFNSYPEFSKLFQGWSSKTMRTIISRAVKHGLIEIGHFNKKKYDNTNWYTLSEKAWQYFPVDFSKLYPASFVDSDKTDSDSTTPAQTGRPPAQTGRPIPENTNSLSSNNTITTNSGKLKSLNLMREMIEVYRETFPDNPQPHPKLIATSLQKTLQTLIKRWPEADPNGKPLDIEAFKRYMVLLRMTAPKFSLGQYETKDGNFKKNGMETFCRWNTLVKFLENQYS